MLLTEDLALHAHHAKLSPRLGEDVAVNARQIAGEFAIGPVEGEPSLSGANRDTQVPTSSSELFLRRGDEVAVLSKGRFLDGLEEFEKFPLREQKKRMKRTMAKV